MSPQPQQSAQIREELIDALHLDLIGPAPDDTIHDYEQLDREPSRWYLSGFLVPYEAKYSDRVDPVADDEFNAPSEDKSLKQLELEVLLSDREQLGQDEPESNTKLQKGCTKLPLLYDCNFKDFSN